MSRATTTAAGRLLIVAALALAAPLTLSGCSLIGNAVSGGVENVVEGAVEGATGTDIESGTDVPSDFPAEVPLLDGTISYAGALGSDGDKIWTVAVEVSGLDAYDQISADMQAAGFAVDFEGTSSDGATGSFSTDTLGALITVAEDGNGGYIATYVVTTISS